jgi:hypothetical protein
MLEYCFYKARNYCISLLQYNIYTLYISNTWENNPRSPDTDDVTYIFSSQMNVSSLRLVGEKLMYVWPNK